MFGWHVSGWRVSPRVPGLSVAGEEPSQTASVDGVPAETGSGGGERGHCCSVQICAAATILLLGLLLIVMHCLHAVTIPLEKCRYLLPSLHTAGQGNQHFLPPT